VPRPSVRRLWPLLLLLAAVGAVCLGARGRSDALTMAEHKSVDWRFRNFYDASRRHPDIALVMLDQASLDHFEKDGIPWPWPRSLYAAALDFLRKAGAKTVVVDILFTSASPIGADQDQELARAMKASGNVVAAMSSTARKGPPPPERFEVSAPGLDAASVKASAQLPIPALLSAAAGLGDTAALSDPDGGLYPTLGAAGAMAFSGKPLAELLPAGLSNGLLPLRYHGKSLLAPADPRDMKTYPVYSLGDLVLSYQALEEGRKPAVDPEALRGKLVFVGMSADGLFDNRPSPISAKFPGTEVLAVTADNMLQGDAMRDAGAWPVALLVLAGLLAAGVASRNARYAWVSIGLTAAASAALAGASIAAFQRGVLLDMAVPQLALWLGFAAASAWSFAVEGRQHRYIQAAFGHYLSPEIVRRIADSPDSLKLGGERREVTFYFSDIAGFTTFSEKLEPEQLTKLMNTYLGHMTDTVLETGGTLDKYIGDAVMAFWGAPLPVEGHALVACKAALTNQAKLVKLREEWAKAGWPPVHNRIGLNTGPAIIGNMGSPKRFSYTAIGDNVNLASRLEGANKPYGTGIMISESTRKAAGDAVEVRELDYIKVKGKNLPIRVYELLGLKGETDPKLLAKARKFEEGLALLRARKLDEARAAFRAVVAEFGEDEACELFLERCDEVAAEPPPPDWDGSFALTEK
jgi:adenylate cyclase